MLRNRIVYATLALGSILSVYYKPNLITSIFFHTMVYISLLSSIHLLYSYITVKVSQKLDPIVVEHGQKSKYICNIYNEGFIPSCTFTINFLFHSTMFKGQLDSQTFNLSGGSSRQFDFDLYCRYRGVYSVGIDTLEVTDMLNIFKLKVKNIESRNITVLPKVTPLPNFDLAPKAESDLRSVSAISAEGANSLVDVRKFEQGDPLKHIHWKLSARHNELLVRNLERSAQNSTLIFLDTSKGNYDFAKNMIVEDKLMEALVSVTSECLTQKHIVEINYKTFDTVNTTCENREDFREFFSQVAKISFMHPSNIKSTINDYFQEQHYKRSLWGKDIFIFTCHPSLLENKSTLQKLLGNRCSLHIVTASYSSQKTGTYRTSEGIYYYNLSPECSLQDIFVRSIK